jgi:nucleotide-binding universal stress UspA family protein
MLAIKTILHPTDFSKRAEYAFQLACALARDYGARLLIAHVKTPPAAVYGEMGALPPEPAEVEEALKEWLNRIRPVDERITVDHFFLVGEPAEEIVRLAGKQRADIIVMGTHGRRGFGRLLMGSVAEQVVRKAACPVVTIKAPMAEAAPAMETHAAHAFR